MRAGLLLVILGCLVGCGTTPEVEEKASEEARRQKPVVVPERGMTGFAPGRREGQLLHERMLREDVQASRCRKHVKELTRAPHIAGSEANARGANYLSRQLESWGFDVERHDYEVLLPYPVRVGVEVTEPVSFSARLKEMPIASDPDTDRRGGLAPFNAYTPDADILAPVVYVNYGRREDYEALAKLGVDVSGKIVLARYGFIFRGSKAALAEERGAAGLLLYSDPADDGFARGDIYPDGPYRPDHGVQRGSILYMFRYPGDPGTPGRASVAGAEQLTYDEMTSLPQIPTTCLSHVDAEPILENLDGPGVPDGWQGGLPFTYHIGGKTLQVRMTIEMDYALRKITNVVATLPGLRFPDQWIIAGNHRDAWVHGAVDPGSGTAVLLEAARVIGEAAQDGRQPDRTLKIAFWDAEEFGIIGSTEWGEQFAADIDRHGAAYINADTSVSGNRLAFSGVPLMQTVAADVLSSIPRREGGTMLDSLRGPGGLRFGSLGAGSDYTVFLAHLGVPCLDFSSSGPYGTYHTGYDTFAYAQRFIDPGFERHGEMAGLTSTLLARLLHADLLPFDFAAAGRAIADAATERERLHALDLSEVREVAATITDHGAAINALRKDALGRGSIALESAVALNEALARAERALLLPGGLPARPWYRHALHAPDPDVGYGTEPLPPLADALRSNDRAAAQEAANLILAALRRYSEQLEGLRRRLEGFTGVDGEEGSPRR